MRVVFSRWQIAAFLLFLLLVAILVFAISQKRESAQAMPSKRDVAIKEAKSKGIPPLYARSYVEQAERNKIDWRLLAAIGYVESAHGKSPLPGVRSGINSAGCCAGPLQICVSEVCGNVAGQYGADGNGDGRIIIYKAPDAIATGARYIRWLEGVVGSDPALVAAAYNAGPTVVADLRAVPEYPETKEYVHKVLRYRERLLKTKM